ncbi:Stearoyl-CoA 9-desaturase electron transfer partner [Corynebacterium occultum]|uniref:Stearoyl-CoA 9-desaturase electron transfer partner n=1 Tax=Corynebacterium occultum TaxID=2675219 RepID=A0A6B8VU57_9CORY|nr:ferredoxin reductase [Corynebacterium occultum]QGU06639.1 Stearoyl-CoA 9-desaturase electron transfer partner [Corynebacterium occultum]
MASTTRDGLGRARDVLRRFTTPLLPDDYTQLINPLWSTRELRGKIEVVETAADDTIHLVISPGWGVPVDFEAGQYIGIGVQIDGRYTWRSYSLTNTPDTTAGHFSITVRAVERGRLSNHLVGTAKAGDTVRLAAPAGDFHLTNPIPEKLLFITAGSGITPVISMLRTMKDRNLQSDVRVVHSVRRREDLVFGDVLEGVDATVNYTSESGRVGPKEIKKMVPDFAERVVYACGPALMLDQVEEWAEAHDMEIRTERFTIDRASEAKGGTVTFGERGSIEVDGATTILEAGESIGIQMPFGCRMGICQTCVRQLDEGHVHDLRSGQTHEPGSRIRTCVCVAAGDVTIDV